MVSAEIGGHWVARVEALVPPVYSADAATSSTTHPHSPPTTPIRDPRPQTHLTHTHSRTHVCVRAKKGSEYFGTFPVTAAVLAVGPKNGPKVRWWRIGQNFCRSKLFTCSLILEGEGTSIYCNANCKPGPRTTIQTFVKTNHAH